MELATLILAAGESKRFGSCKHLVELDDETLIERQISLAQHITPGHVAVVVGAYANELRDKIGSKAHVFENKFWQRGIGASIAYGVNQLKEYDAILIFLGDQVILKRQELQILKNKWLEDKENIVCARYEGVLGVPAIFPKEYFSEMSTLKEDVGAKYLIQRYMKNTIIVDLPSARFDLDTLADLEMLVAQGSLSPRANL